MSDHFTLLAHANGTHTLVDTENGQAMHSRIGPAEEARLVYADLARLERRLDSSDRTVVLYDVGMGTGANVIAAFERIQTHPESSGHLQIYSFELKPEGLRAAIRAIDQSPDPFPSLRPWTPTLRRLLETDGNGESQLTFLLGAVRVTWNLRVGEFYTRMLEAPSPDVVFFDFYSPKVVPELWSLERFQSLRGKIAERRAELYTYSAATPVRLHLLASGFYVGEGVSTGVKNETTVAATHREALTAPLPRDWLGKLDRSTSVAGPGFERAKTLARAHPQWN